MTNVSFNPFGLEQTLENLEPGDLSVLQDVAEGWYVEYKREVVSSRNIAKSLAAFANHYGGWIFYGVNGTNDGTNVASNFPGLDTGEVSLLIERLRNASKDCIIPSPFYDHKIIRGPSDQINLPEGKSVVVVKVPSGPNTPYLHIDGRIYRRIADSSDPKPEIDRLALDHLWQRGQRARDRLTEFLEMEPELSKGEEGVSFLDIFLLPDPLEASGQTTKLTFKTFVDLINDQDRPGFSFPFDNFYSMPGGVVARQVSTNNPSNLVFTWRHFNNGFSWISVPLSSGSSVEAAQFLRGYNQSIAMSDLIAKGNYKPCTLIDLNQIISIMLAVIWQQQRLMEEGQIKGPLYAKTVLHNVWRRIPFFDTESYIQFALEHGLPLIQFSDHFVPSGRTYETLRLLPENNVESDAKSPLQKATVQAVPLMMDIFSALGLPPEIMIAGEDWWSAAERAAEVNKRRSEEFPFRNLS